jgi:hypothetical protein
LTAERKNNFEHHDFYFLAISDGHETQEGSWHHHPEFHPVIPRRGSWGEALPPTAWKILPQFPLHSLGTANLFPFSHSLLLNCPAAFFLTSISNHFQNRNF